MNANRANHPTATEAITFALDCLEPFEVCAYLLEWRDGMDLTPWAKAHMEDRDLQYPDNDVSVQVRTTGRDIHERRTNVGKECAEGLP